MITLVATGIACFSIVLAGLVSGTPLLRTGGLSGLAACVVTAFLLDAWRASALRLKVLRWRAGRTSEVLADIDYQLVKREPLGLTANEIEMLRVARRRITRKRERLLREIGHRGAVLFHESVDRSRRRAA